MSAPGAVRQQPSSVQYSRIKSKYPRRPLREYGALPDQVDLREHPNGLPSYVPSKQPSPSPPSTFKFKDPPPPPTTPHQRRNPLQKPPPRNREPSIQTNAARTDHTLDPPIPNNTSFGRTKSSYPRRDGPPSYCIPPPRPSRTKPITLDDMFPSRSTSTRVIGPFNSLLAGDPTPHPEEVHGDPSVPCPDVDSPSTPRPAGVDTASTKGATVTKGKKGVLGFMSDLLGSNKRVGIGAPPNPVLTTNIGPNASDVEFTGLPKERQQLLPGGSGISRKEQEENRWKVINDIFKSNQGARGGEDVWAKTGAAPRNGLSVLPAPPPKQLPTNRPTLDLLKRPDGPVPLHPHQDNR